MFSFALREGSYRLSPAEPEQRRHDEEAGVIGIVNNLHGVNTDSIPCPAPCNAEDAVGGECSRHGAERIAEPANGTDVDLIDSVQPIEWKCIVNSVQRIADNCRIIGEKRDERGGKEACDERHTHRTEGRKLETCCKPLAYASEIAGTGVLPDEAREGNAECEQRIVEESLDACIDGHTCHRSVAEGVDVGLDDERGDAHKDSLHSGGDACAEDGDEIVRCKEGAAQ